jgi:divalent metal cation (Fe/Co/Zn/Cd) transporter
VREVHNVSVLDVDGRTEVSLHLKLPAELPLDRAHAIATSVERAIVAAVAEVDAVQTHLEPLAAAGAGTEVERERAGIMRIVEEATGHPPRELRFLETDEGLVAFLTLGIEGDAALADAHARASEVEERIRRAHPEVAEVVVHTEP